MTIRRMLAPNQIRAYSSRSLPRRIRQKTKSITAMLPSTEIIWMRGFIAGPPNRARGRPDTDREQDFAHVVERADEGDRRMAALALAHRHRHLDHPKTLAGEGDDRFGLRVVVGIILGQEG